MTKRGTRAEINTFVQGIITEASPLNFPPNASKDEENFELNADGSRDRRLGMDWENLYALKNTGVASTTDYVTFMPNVYKWTSVGSVAGRDFIAVQIGARIHFCEDTTGSWSFTSYKGYVDIPVGYGVSRMSFASIDGRLIVAKNDDRVYSVEYDGASFTSNPVVLYVRDIWGVEETVVAGYESSPTYRGVNSDEHKYNMYNQGWYIARTYKDGTTVDPYLRFGLDLGVYPSNSDVVWTGMQFQPVAAGADPSERFFPAIYKDTVGIAGTAPKGHFIINPFARGFSRSAVFGAAVLPDDLVEGGPTVICEYAGRVFYAGANGPTIDGDARSPSMSNHILFSQVVSGRDSIGKCYQEGDPTSRDSSDVVDTDGGVIKITGIKNVVAMKNLETHLIVIATNGVWAISGGGDYGFTATNYKVSKISAFGAINGDSVVVEGGRVYYWGEDGIYVLEKDQMGDLVVKGMTQNTIHSFYSKIPQASKNNVFGVHDPYSRKIRWIYQDTSGATTYTKELIFDTVLGAFYPYKISNGLNNTIIPIMAVAGKAYEASSSKRSGDFQSVRYLTLVKSGGTWNWTFSLYHNESFRDWEYSGNPVDAKAYMFTGAVTGGDSSAYKQVPYCVFHFRKTEMYTGSTVSNESSCLARFLWDWSNTLESKRWSNRFQVYRLRKAQFLSETANNDNGLETTVTKNKVRGRGRAFAMYVETEPGKDCRLLGWSLTLNGNSNV